MTRDDEALMLRRLALVERKRVIELEREAKRIKHRFLGYDQLMKRADHWRQEAEQLERGADLVQQHGAKDDGE